MLRALLPFLLFSSFCFVGCKDPRAPRQRPIVVATTTFVADLVRQLAGDTVFVQGLMGPGVDPHLYRATTKDVVALSQADLILYNGLMLEGRMTDILKNQKAQGRPLYALSEALPKATLFTPPDSQGQPDPHIWFDPDIWIRCTQALAKQLGNLLPQNKEAYQERAQELCETFKKLHTWGRQKLEAIPARQRVLITSHDAFNYFGRAFGLDVIGVQGISTETEPGLQDLSNTVRLIKERNIQAIFVESSVAPKTIKEIADRAGVRVGPELFSDAMGDPGVLQPDPEGGAPFDTGTWQGMLKHNIYAVIEGLQPQKL